MRLAIIFCLLIASEVYAEGFLTPCQDPKTGMVTSDCIEKYSKPGQESNFSRGGDEVVSIRRSGDDTLIVEYDDGSYDDLHRRPDGTWGKGLWIDSSSGTTLSK